MAPKPRIIRPQVAGSGTPPVRETPSSRAKGGWVPLGPPMARKERVSVLPVAVKVITLCIQPLKP
jgi:hypothetical protein